MLSLLYGLTLTSIYDYWKNHSFDYRDLWLNVSKVIPLLFNTVSRFVIVFLPRSKHLLILWLQSPSAVILAFKKIKSVALSIIPPSICHEVIELDPTILVFWIVSFKLDYLSSSRGSLFPLHFHSSGIICISQVIDISPGSLDSSLCFIQPTISHDVLCI